MLWLIASSYGFFSPPHSLLFQADHISLVISMLRLKGWFCIPQDLVQINYSVLISVII